MRILLVEDNGTSARFIAKGLREAAYAVDVAADGVRAPALCAENDYDLVLSFSGIYLLAVIFEGQFDELRAERAMQESLPRIERLVLALPPLDPGPEPMGGVVAFRRRRR